MDCGKVSVDLARRVLDRFGARLHYVITQNQVRGENFYIFEKSAVKPQVLKLGAMFVCIRQLMRDVMHKIDTSSAAFAIGRHPKRNNTSPRLVDRQRLKSWQSNVCAQLI
jgi:hypothetical protein